MLFPGYLKDQTWEAAIGACLDFINANPDYTIRIIFGVLREGPEKWENPL